jgi:hypothetical protein
MTTYYRTTGYPYGNLWAPKPQREPEPFSGFGGPNTREQGLHYRWYPVAVPPSLVAQNPHGFVSPVQSGPQYTPLPANYSVPSAPGNMTGTSTREALQEERPDLDFSNPELEPLWPMLDAHVENKQKDAAAIAFAVGAIGTFLAMSIWQK